MSLLEVSLINIHPGFLKSSDLKVVAIPIWNDGFLSVSLFLQRFRTRIQITPNALKESSAYYASCYFLKRVVVKDVGGVIGAGATVLL
ncbi:MAG TPA: hypothetical protein VFI73_14290 [Candidatus Nitrosopolaris sp.]|nr:hypothetical protein [Candidatus Nitrosopolaris sp.]